MSEPFLAEIRIVGFTFPPRGWAFCDGQILPINQNQSLYSLLGTTYGGDGRTNFALPDLRGRTPIHPGSNGSGGGHGLGNKSGEETHSLQTTEIANHTHTLMASNDVADQAFPAQSGSQRVWARSTSTDPGWAQTNDTVEMASPLDTGGDQAHENMQPFLALNFCIALRGLFPSRN